MLSKSLRTPERRRVLRVLVVDPSVDDVRRVREKRDREVQGDIHALAERSREAAEKYRVQLGLKVVAVPPKDARN